MFKTPVVHNWQIYKYSKYVVDKIKMADKFNLKIIGWKPEDDGNTVGKC